MSREQGLPLTKVGWQIQKWKSELYFISLDFYSLFPFFDYRKELYIIFYSKFFFYYSKVFGKLYIFYTNSLNIYKSNRNF